MKKVSFVFLFVVAFVSTNVCAQVASATCTTVSLDSPPTYNGGLVTASSWACTKCNGQCYDQLLSNNVTYLTIYSYLQRKVNGVWQSYGNGLGKYGDYPSWTVSDPGTYRIKIIKPAILPDAACPSGRDVKNASGTIVGKRGYTPTSGTPVYSNEVIAGVVTPDQVSFTFVDGGGGNSNNSAFDYLELVRINTSNSKNYNQYSITITESGGANRVKSTGLVSGTMPTLFDLTNLWKTNNPTWNFEMSWYYNVSVGLYNSCSSSGTFSNSTFTICPPGSGCREIIKDESNEIAIAPNPVANEMHISELPIEASTIILTDVNGRMVKSFDNSGSDRFDVSDINNGMYFVNILGIDGKQIFQSKVFVQN